MSKKWLALIISVMLTASLGAGCGGSSNRSNTGDTQSNGQNNTQCDEIKVGFTFMGSRTEPGWVAAQENGRHYLEQQMPGVETIMMDSIPAGEKAREAFEKLIDEGCTIIFSTSYEHQPDVNIVAAQHPDIVFLQCAGTQTAANVGTYFGYIEQCNYLAGMVAGLMTKTNQVGFVASVSVPEVFRDINAFTLGVRSVNPQAQVQAGWTLSWYDPRRDEQIAQALIASGCDVLGHDVASDAVQKTAEKAGCYGIGYNVDMRESAPTRNLTSAIWNWGPYYVDTVKSVQAGEWESSAYIGGLDSGMVDIAPLSDAIPAQAQQQVEQARQQMIAGDLKVFAGPIYDRSGQLRVPAGQEASSELLLGMDWLVEGASSPFKFY